MAAAVMAAPPGTNGTDHQPGECAEDALMEKRSPDMSGSGTKRESNADFPGALGD